MATSGYFQTYVNIDKTVIFRAEWKQTKNVTNNTSTITVTNKLIIEPGVTYQLTNQYQNTTASGGCTIDGVEYKYSAKTYSGTAPSSGITLTLGSVTSKVFSHDSSGNLGAIVIWPVQKQFMYFNGSSTAVGGVGIPNKTIYPESISRVSNLTCSTAYIGDTAKITISKPVSNFTDTITYTFNGLTGTIATKTSATSINWTIPDSFYAKIPNATSGKGTLKVQTYDASGTSLGTKSISFTVLVKEEISKPTLNPTVEDSNDVTYALTGDRNTFIRYFSKAVFYTGATARNSATLVTEYCKNGDTVISSTAGEFPEVVSGKFTFVAIDSRGFSGIQEVEKNFIEYSKLTCNLANNKPSPDGKLEIMVDGKFFDGSFGTTSNSLTVEYRFKKKDDAEFSPWTAMSPMMSTAELSYSAYALITDLDYKTIYVYEARATDKLMTAVSVQRVVKATPVFDWSEEDINFNVPVYMHGRPTIHRDEDTNVLTLSTNTSMDIEAPDGFRVEGHNLLGLMKSMARRYELPIAMTTIGTPFDEVEINLYLYGNVVRGYLHCLRYENLTAGDIGNQHVLTVKFIHDGKLTGFGANSFCSGGSGSVATFNMSETNINNRSGSFTIHLCAIATADSEWTCYFTFPALLNFDAFMDDYIPEADTDDGTGGTSQETVTGTVTSIDYFSNGKIASMDIDSVYHPVSTSVTISNPDNIKLTTGLTLTAEITDGYITYFEYNAPPTMTVYVNEGVTAATAAATYHSTDTCPDFATYGTTPTPLTFTEAEGIPDGWTACSTCYDTGEEEGITTELVGTVTTITRNSSDKITHIGIDTHDGNGETIYPCIDGVTHQNLTGSGFSTGISVRITLENGYITHFIF